MLVVKEYAITPIDPRGQLAAWTPAADRDAGGCAHATTDGAFSRAADRNQLPDRRQRTLTSGAEFYFSLPVSRVTAFIAEIAGQPFLDFYVKLVKG